MMYLITYDIANDKRRKKLSDLLEGYGVRVNYSVFECELTQTKLERLLYEIELQDLVDKKYDSLRFYFIHPQTLHKCFEYTDKAEPFEPMEMVF